jgi:type IV secretion system protein VirD4
MTLSTGDNAWLKPAFITLMVLTIFGVWAYLGGGIFMMAQHRKFEEATPLTLYQYWVYYGSEEPVRRWLYISSGISLALLLAPLVFFFAPARRSLFGDARFATTSEIKKAGLLGT